jgi:spermidine/putrescine transport system ATP-binding protein
MCDILTATCMVRVRAGRRRSIPSHGANLREECPLADDGSAEPGTRAGPAFSGAPAALASAADTGRAGSGMTPDGSSPDVRLVDLTKRFRDLTAVDAISIDIAAGEFFSLLGPSGCGKTTTLRMIGGFEYPTSGSVQLRGRDVTMDPPERRPVNMVFQSYALFPHLCVFDNVAFGLRRRKVPDADARRRVSATLELVRLTGFDRRSPAELSGGQQQRVALARALVCEPTVLLLDEPLGALDLKLRRQLQVELKRVQVEVGITFVYVTHDQEEALALSDRIAVMNGGRIEQLGTPEELYDRPVSRFVADFIGTSNLLGGTVVSAAEGIVEVALEAGGRCRARADGLAPGAAVEIAVRPEALELVPRDGPATDAPPDGAGGSWLRGTIEQSAYLGTSISYQVRTDGGRQVAATVSRTHDRLAAGTSVDVQWRPEDGLVLRGSARAGDEKEDPR